jgi:hypothetical protein
MMNRATVPLSPGERYHAEGCVALGWKLAGIIADPPRGTGQHPIVFMPYGALVIAHFLDGYKRKKEPVLCILKERDTPYREIPRKRNSSAGGWELWYTTLGHWHNQ